MSATLDAVYDAFASYGRPPTFRACNCCIADANGQWGSGDNVDMPSPGRGAALREVTAEELRAFAENVPGTCGDIASLKHYLPRILELAKNTGPYGETDFPELGDVLPKLARLGDPEFPPWWEWPDPERIALRNFMREEWQLACQATDAHDTAGVLGAVLNTDPEIDPYLETWAAAPVDRLRRVEAASWIERPSAEFAPGFARANWQKVRDWVYAQT